MKQLQARDDGMAVASAGPNANHLHLAADRYNHASTSSLKSTEGIWVLVKFLERVHYEVSLIDSAVLRSVAFPKGRGGYEWIPPPNIAKTGLNN